MITSVINRRDSLDCQAIAYAVQRIPKQFNQTPRYEVKVGSNYEEKSIYFLGNSSSEANAEGKLSWLIVVGRV